MQFLGHEAMVDIDMYFETIELLRIERPALEQAVQEAIIALQTANAALEKNAADMTAQYKSFSDVVMPSCMKAVQRYNAEPDRSLRIAPGSIRLGYSRQKKTLGAHTRLAYLDGREPDEDFDSLAEMQKISDAFKILFDEELAAAELPYTFSTLYCPSEYFTK
jgi:hypothetical protein